MPEDRKTLYRAHVENLRSIDIAIKSVREALRDAIAFSREGPERALSRTYLFLVGAWAETRLQKILLEPNAGAEAVLASHNFSVAQIDQWGALVRNAYDWHRLNSSIEGSELSYLEKKKDSLLQLLDSDLKPVIGLRNKIAHGGFVYAINSKRNAINSDATADISSENYLSIEFKHQILDSIANMINYFLLSPPAFIRDFDMEYGKMEQARIRLTSRSFENFKTSLVTQRQRARDALAAGRENRQKYHDQRRL